ncbi:MAG: SAM-dependent methyltransferase, partial [Janthinobacterium lividum]
MTDRVLQTSSLDPSLDDPAADRSESIPRGLLLVATPIGNLADMSRRALQALRQADLVLCEDTRQTARLLQHYGITVRTTPLHD